MKKAIIAGAAAAAGAALGSSAAIAADRVYENLTSEEEVKDEDVKPEDEVKDEEEKSEDSEDKTEESKDTAATETVDNNDTPAAAAHTTAQPVHHTSVASNQAEAPTQHVVVEHHVIVDEPAGQQGASQAVNVSQPINTGGDVVDDGEVQVLGVGIADNEHGGVATLATLQSGDEVALVADLDTDGTIDIIAIDENENGVIEDHEIHDVHDMGLATDDVIDAYIDQSEARGEVAVLTDIDSGDHYAITGDNEGYNLVALDDTNDGLIDDQLYTASNDDMDYMNDVDAGMIDV